MRRAPLYRRYGSNLPSSLTRILSNASEYSSRPPVSVCGTGGARPHAASFSRRHGITGSPPEEGSHHASPTMPPGLAWGTGRTLGPRQPPRGPAIPPCHCCAVLLHGGVLPPPDPGPRKDQDARQQSAHHVSDLTVTHRRENIDSLIHSTTPVGLALGPG